MENYDIKTKRNNKKLQHQGGLYIFHKHNADKNVKFWRCEDEHDGCRARVHTSLEDVVLKSVGQHSCGPSASNVITQQIVTTIKRRAADTIEPPAAIRALCLQQVPTPVLANVPNKDAIRKVVRRVRHEMEDTPAIPASLEMLVIPENFKFYERTSTELELFLLADSGIYTEHGRDRQQRLLVFGRRSFGLWASQMKSIYADGTFSITPTIFSQVYCILARRENWVFPVLYCLLTSKTAETYQRMFRTILEFWPDFAPESISMDFEAAAIGAAKLVFPNCAVDLCLFHLVRNMKKKVYELGLARNYREVEFANKCRMITSIAFLPLAHITSAIAALENVIEAELQPLLDWFVDYYTGRPRFNGTRTQPLFAPEMWSVHERTLEAHCRTNNFAEAAHKRLHQAFACDHPTIWTFIKILRREQKLVDANFAKFVAGHEPPKKARRYREADKRILRLVRRYRQDALQPEAENGHQYLQLAINPQKIIELLTGISYNYQMNP